MCLLYIDETRIKIINYMLVVFSTYPNYDKL